MRGHPSIGRRAGRPRAVVDDGAAAARVLGSGVMKASARLLLPLLVLLSGFTTPRAVAGDDGIKVWTEPVAGSEIPVAIVEAVVDFAPAVIWPIISRCADYKARMPRIASSKELTRAGDENKAFTTTCEVTADLPFPLSDLTSVSRADHTVEPGVRYVRRWKMLSGDYDVNEGSWTLVAIDGGARTKVTYRLRAKPRIPLPDAMLRQAQYGTLPDMMRNLRSQAALAAAAAPRP
jgi:hypothetical protein